MVSQYTAHVAGHRGIENTRADRGQAPAPVVPLDRDALREEFEGFLARHPRMRDTEALADMAVSIAPRTRRRVRA